MRYVFICTTYVLSSLLLLLGTAVDCQASAEAAAGTVSAKHSKKYALTTEKKLLNLGLDPQEQWRLNALAQITNLLHNKGLCEVSTKSVTVNMSAVLSFLLSFFLSLPFLPPLPVLGPVWGAPYYSKNKIFRSFLDFR